MLPNCCLCSPSDAVNCLLGPPMDPDEDSDNSSVYVQGLNDNVTLEDLADFFKQCGVVKVRGTHVRSSAPAHLQRAEHGEGDWVCPPPPCPACHLSPPAAGHICLGNKPTAFWGCLVAPAFPKSLCGICPSASP